jgi:hypothetical protein
MSFPGIRAQVLLIERVDAAVSTTDRVEAGQHKPEVEMKGGSRLWTSMGVVGVLALAAPVSGQTCLAVVDLDDLHSVTLSGGADFFEGGHTYSGWGTFGGDVFLLAGYDHTDLVGVVENSKRIEGGLGITAVSTGKISACLLGTAGYGLGLADGVTSYDLIPAVAVAYDDLIPTSRWDLIPAARAGVAYSNWSVDGMSELDVDRTDGFVEIALGLVGPGGGWGVRPAFMLRSDDGSNVNIFSLTLNIAGGT